MKLEQRRELRGKFWLPEHRDDPEHQLSGTLTVTRSGSLFLDLDVPEDYRQAARPDHEGRTALLGIPYASSRRVDALVCGQLRDGTFVALGECRYSVGPVAPLLLALGNQESRIWPTRAVLGRHPIDVPPVLAGINMTLEGLDKWMDITGIRMEPFPWFKEPTFSMSKSTAELSGLEISSGERTFRLSSSFFWVGSASRTHEVVIGQVPRVRITPSEDTAVPVPDLLRVAKVFQRFVWFATNRPMRLLSVSGDHRERIYESEWLPSPEGDEPEVRWPDMLFLFGDVRGREGALLEGWFRLYEEREWIVDLYLNMCLGRNAARNVLVDSVQCLEKLAQRDREDPKTRRLFDEVVESCCGPAKRWIKQKAWLCKERRTEALLSLLAPYSALIEEPEELVGNLWTCRGRLVHGGTSGQFDVGSLARRGLALLRMVLLERIGFAPDEICLMVRSDVGAWGWRDERFCAMGYQEAKEELKKLRSQLAMTTVEE